MPGAARPTGGSPTRRPRSTPPAAPGSPKGPGSATTRSRRRRTTAPATDDVDLAACRDQTQVLSPTGLHVRTVASRSDERHRPPGRLSARRSSAQLMRRGTARVARTDQRKDRSAAPTTAAPPRLTLVRSETPARGEDKRRDLRCLPTRQTTSSTARDPDHRLERGHPATAARSGRAGSARRSRRRRRHPPRRGDAIGRRRRARRPPRRVDPGRDRRRPTRRHDQGGTRHLPRKHHHRHRRGHRGRFGTRPDPHPSPCRGRQPMRRRGIRGVRLRPVRRELQPGPAGRRRPRQQLVGERVRKRGSDRTSPWACGVFVLGGHDTTVDHVVAADNGVFGFTSILSSGDRFLNDTAYNNGFAGFQIAGEHGVTVVTAGRGYRLQTSSPTTTASASSCTPPREASSSAPTFTTTASEPCSPAPTPPIGR